jgi:hypothetical protein
MREKEIELAVACVTAASFKAPQVICAGTAASQAEGAA